MHQLLKNAARHSVDQKMVNMDYAKLIIVIITTIA